MTEGFTRHGVESFLLAVPGVVLVRVLEANCRNDSMYEATIQIVYDDALNPVELEEALMTVEERKPAALVFRHENIKANDGHRTIAANRWLLHAWQDVQWARAE